MRTELFPVSADWAARAYINDERYAALYDASIKDPETFWRAEASRLDWMKPFTKVKNVSYDAKDLHIKWFEDGELNVSVNYVCESVTSTISFLIS